MSTILMWVIAVFMFAVGGYTGYANWTGYMKSKKAKKQFIENNLEAKTEYISRFRPWLFLILGVICLGLSIFMAVVNAQLSYSDRYAQVCVYVGLAVFCVAMAGQAFMDSEIVYDDDAFMLESTPIRFRNISKVEIAKGWFGGATLVLSGNKQQVVAKTVARWIQKSFLQWKQEKKAAKKRKGRG